MCDLNPASPCLHCGAPTIRGVNSDFCSMECEEQHAAADWMVLSVTDRGPCHFYRFQVEGENLSARPMDRHFCWSVTDLKDARYTPHPDASPEMCAALWAAKRAVRPSSIRAEGV